LADNSRWASKAFFSTSKFAFACDIPSDAERKELNLFMAINNAMDIAMETDPTATLFGEDVKFGGVFRCSLG
jgi:2-oxoisovalerate dehydrogenase E1 component beta subunit